jgi:murein DD-endopeptidase MepM/ murein hydrolase activator NlpD
MALRVFVALASAVSVLAGDSGITFRARSLQPGEVILLNVVGTPATKAMTAEAFGRSFRLNVDSGTQNWSGLVGIDLTTKPGNYSIKIKAVSANGSARYLDALRLEIHAKEFPTRELTVDNKYVEPSSEALKRIREESSLVSKILAGVTSQKHWQGEFGRPVPGEASSSFGKRSILNGKPRSPHSGTDFRASEGIPVQAPNRGQIVLAKDLYFAGNTIIVDHGQGLYSYFAHLSSFEVKEGDFVDRSDIIGRVGATGRVTGPHLHWAVRLVRARVDPLSLMEAIQTQ